MLVNGTTYHDGTPKAVIDILEDSRRTGRRLHIHYGYTEAKDGKQPGRDWLEEWDVTGHIGRSTGTNKIPLMIANSRSTGGASVLEHCIVKIRDTGGNVLYKHPNYHHGTVVLTYEAGRIAPGKTGPVSLPYRVKVDGAEHAAFKTGAERTRWLSKMGLTVAP